MKRSHPDYTGAADDIEAVLQFLSRKIRETLLQCSSPLSEAYVQSLDRADSSLTHTLSLIISGHIVQRNLVLCIF